MVTVALKLKDACSLDLYLAASVWLPRPRDAASAAAARSNMRTIHTPHQMVNTEIRLIIFFAAKGGEALYSQQKQDRELIVAQIMKIVQARLQQNVNFELPGVQARFIKGRGSRD